MTTNTSPLRVLIVDDAPSMRSLLKALLRQDGYEIAGELGNGNAVLEAVAKLNPQIICLDINLPGTDGITLLKEIHAQYRDIAVVMITGSDDQTLEQVAADNGAAGFIKKPFTQEVILRELAVVAHAQRLLQGNFEPLPLSAEAPMIRAVIADDSATMRQLLTAILTQVGVMVVGEASNGQEAVELAMDNKPELICLDCNMPILSGPDALKQIRPKLPGSKILMISSISSREMILETASSGANGYILKPYHPDKVIAALKQLLHS